MCDVPVWLMSLGGLFLSEGRVKWVDLDEMRGEGEGYMEGGREGKLHSPGCVIYKIRINKKEKKKKCILYSYNGERLKSNWQKQKTKNVLSMRVR